MFTGLGSGHFAKGYAHDSCKGGAPLAYMRIATGRYVIDRYAVGIYT
jgi:hypothetical protein